MLKNRIAKIAGLSVGMTLVLGGFASTAGAQTIAELQAQINALMAQLAALQGGSVSTGTTFTMDLTVGSTGAQVVALQQMLVAQGHLVMPVGVAYGYFGTLTKAAVAKWQAANGIAPAAGYFGPISRARANSMGGTVPGTTIPGGSTSGGITTPGVEGTITVSLNSTPTGVKLYEGDSKKALMGIKLEAKTSDIKIERVKIDLDHVTDAGSNGTLTDTNFYRKIASKIYIMDGSTVLGSMDLNSSTVVEDGSDRFITVSGLNFVVPKDATRVLTVAVDAMSTWDSIYDSDTFSVGVPQDGIRGVDGAGVNQYGPSTGFSRSFTTEGDITEDATLKVSLNTNTPAPMQVIAASGADEDEKDGVELLRFDVRAEKDAVTITDLDATLEFSGSTATTTTVYLMDGSTVLGSESGNVGNGGTVSFTDIDFTVSKDTTKTLRIVADIADATTAVTTFAANVAASGVIAENAMGDDISANVSGTANGEDIDVLKVGPEITLNSKSITKDSIGFSGATSTARATFNVTLKAVGGDIYFGPQTSSSTFNFVTYKGGSATTLLDASSTSWTVPSGVTTSGIASGGFILQEGNTVTLPIEFLFEGRTTAGALLSTDAYAVQLDSIKWNTGGATQVTTDFMSGRTEWRTSSVTMP